jgi:hypothetical protein
MKSRSGLRLPETGPENVDDSDTRAAHVYASSELPVITREEVRTYTIHWCQSGNDR